MVNDELVVRAFVHVAVDYAEREVLVTVTADLAGASDAQFAAVMTRLAEIQSERRPSGYEVRYRLAPRTGA